MTIISGPVANPQPQSKKTRARGEDKRGREDSLEEDIRIPFPKRKRGDAKVRDGRNRKGTGREKE